MLAENAHRVSDMNNPEVIVALLLGLALTATTLVLEAATPGVQSLITPEGLLAGLLVALFGAIPFTVLAIRQHRADAGNDWSWLAIAVYWLAVLGLIGNYRLKLFVVYAILVTAAVWLVTWLARQANRSTQGGAVKAGTGKKDKESDRHGP